MRGWMHVTTNAHFYSVRRVMPGNFSFIDRISDNCVSLLKNLCFATLHCSRTYNQLLRPLALFWRSILWFLAYYLFSPIWSFLILVVFRSLSKQRFRSPLTGLSEDVGGISVPPSSHLPEETSSKLFSLLDPVYGEHRKLLAILEARLTSWVEKRSKKTSDESSVSSPQDGETTETTETVYRVGDLFVENLRILPVSLPFSDKFIPTARSLQCHTRDSKHTGWDRASCW